MFCSRTLNNSLNQIQERALCCLLYDNHNSYFYDILEMSNEKSKHKKNIEHPAKEIYKSVNGISPPIVKKDKQLDK